MFSTEVGLSFMKTDGDIVSPRATCFYSSINFFPRYDIYGIKAGIEKTGHLSVFGFEVRYLSNFENSASAILITPKIGIGCWGVINILYGRHFPLKNNHEKFNIISKHQISLIININKQMFTTH